MFGNRFVITFDKETKSILGRLFISATVMRVVIAFVYKTQISIVYNYSGFQNNYSVSAAIISLFLMYSILPFVAKCIKEPCFSRIVLYLLYLLNFVPGTILMSYMRLSYVIPWYIYYFLLFFIGTSFEVKRSYINHKCLNKKSVYLIAGLFSLIILYIWIYYARGRIQLGLDDLYSTRLEARDFGMPMVFRYVFASMKIVLPVFVVWSIKNKNHSIAIVFSIIQLIIFFTDGSKSTLFALLAAISGYYFLRGHERRISLFPWIFSGIGILSILEYAQLNSFTISGIFIRRIMFVPNSLNIRYYDFFTNNPPDYFTSGFLKVFGFQSRYGSIARMIGKYYTGSDSLAANNGLFSDAVANLGIIGILVMPIVIALLLHLMDTYSAGIDIYTIIGSVIPFTMALMSASFFTMFLSHGVIALIIVFYFVPRQNEHIQDG